MTDSSDYGIGRKRKADFALRNEDDDDSSSKQQKAPESYLATEEELRKRRIVKVVRSGSTVEADTAPRGRFTFMNSNILSVNQSSQEKKQEERTVPNSNKKITVTTSTIRLNKPVTDTPVKIEKNEEKEADVKENKSEIKKEKEDGKEEMKSYKDQIKLEATSSELKSDINQRNSTDNEKEDFTSHPDAENVASTSITVNKQEVSVKNQSTNSDNNEKKLNFSDRQTITSINSIPSTISIQPVISSSNDTNKLVSKAFPFQNTSASSGFSSNCILNTNPFSKQNTSTTTTNIFNKEGNTTTSTNNINRNPFAAFSSANTTNPFASSGYSSTTSSFKPSFNFNLANAPSNPNWNSDDEDDGEDINPEEEIKISGKDSTHSKLVENLNPNLIKFVKIQLNDLSEYNFVDKKYQSKGKGDIAIELTRTDKDKVVAICVYRNNALKILFQGNIIYKVTSLTLNNKNFKHIIVVQKLFAMNESTNKPEGKSVKLEFQSENDFNQFNEKFEKAIEIVDNNDISVFPVRNQDEN